MGRPSSSPGNSANPSWPPSICAGRAPQILGSLLSRQAVIPRRSVISDDSSLLNHQRVLGQPQAKLFPLVRLYVGLITKSTYYEEVVGSKERRRNLQQLFPSMGTPVADHRKLFKRCLSVFQVAECSPRRAVSLCIPAGTQLV